MLRTQRPQQCPASFLPPAHVCCCLCCCSIFFYEATHGSLTAISSLTFLTPMFAAGAGFMFLGETLTPVQLIGAAITLAAVFMINTPASHKPREGAAKKE
jgi:drug/metabolite transporter (DMT)-like permease